MSSHTDEKTGDVAASTIATPPNEFSDGFTDDAENEFDRKADRKLVRKLDVSDRK